MSATGGTGSLLGSPPPAMQARLGSRLGRTAPGDPSPLSDQHAGIIPRVAQPLRRPVEPTRDPSGRGHWGSPHSLRAAGLVKGLGVHVLFQDPEVEASPLVPSGDGR